MRVLVTGGCGFIGANFLAASRARWPNWEFLNVDALTYAAASPPGRASGEAGAEPFRQLDLCDATEVAELVREFQPQLVVHFAAETHVDRSIYDPRSCLRTNVEGTVNLLESCRQLAVPPTFHLVSTDEVYGPCGDVAFDEGASYHPSSPYAASKAAANHWTHAYHRTYGLDVRITNGANTYGPRQFPEKLVPLVILRLLKDEPLPIYGSGLQVRDWLYVDDHCEAIWSVIERGRTGQTYNVASGARVTNLELVRRLCELVAHALGVDPESKLALIHHVADRPGHDAAYHVDATRVSSECGWRPKVELLHGLKRTVNWYLSHTDWLERAIGGDYEHWLQRNYRGRGGYSCG